MVITHPQRQRETDGTTFILAWLIWPRLTSPVLPLQKQRLKVGDQKFRAWPMPGGKPSFSLFRVFALDVQPERHSWFMPQTLPAMKLPDNCFSSSRRKNSRIPALKKYATGRQVHSEGRK